MKRSFRTLLLASLVLFAPSVLAGAPLGQYDQFVRDTGTIRDTFTKLEWERCAAGQACRADAAQTTRTRRLWAAAQGSACAAFGGRLPTVKELLTLVDEQPHQEYEFGKTVSKAIDQDAFGTYTSEDAAYWSSSPADQPGRRWGVSFRDGTMVSLPENDPTGFYVRCVR